MSQTGRYKPSYKNTSTQLLGLIIIKIDRIIWRMKLKNLKYMVEKIMMKLLLVCNYVIAATCIIGYSYLIYTAISIYLKQL